MRITVQPYLVLTLFVVGCSPLPETQSHDLAGQIQSKTTVVANDSQKAIDELLALMRQRLLIMHDVARYKWHAKLPVADLKREEELPDQVIEQGSSMGIEPFLTRKFFQAQIVAGKLVQQADFDRWQKQGHAPPVGGRDLKALRADIDALTQKLLTALAQTYPMLKQAEGQKALHERMHVVLHGEGITDKVRQVACTPLF